MRSFVPLQGLLLVLLVAGAPAVADGDAEGVALDRYFKGKVESFEDDVLTLSYDLSEKKQMEDWYESVPFPVDPREDQGIEWLEETIEIRGNTGIRHVGEWKGDIEVTCRVILHAVKDIGGLLTPVEDTEDFATFTLAETFFHKWDNQTGGTNSIIKFGEQFRERGFAGDFIGFRYISRKPPKKPLIRGRTVPLTFGLRRSRLYMDVKGQELKGNDIGVKLKLHRPGFYAVRGRCRFDDIRVKGKLDPNWMRLCGIAARVDGPEDDAEDDAEDEAAPEDDAEGGDESESGDG